MARNRIFPTLLLDNGRVVKGIQYKKHQYIGDPLNTVRTFNEYKVDELLMLDISATKNGKIDFRLIENIANECNFPLGYGGGIRTFKDAKRIFEIGLEKICLNTAALECSEVIHEITSVFGVQSVVISIDISKDLFGNYKVFSHTKHTRLSLDLSDYIDRLSNLGIGELYVSSVEREGSWNGFDCKLYEYIKKRTHIPVVASGGAGSTANIEEVFKTGVEAATLGSMAVFQKKGMGVLVNFPDYKWRKSFLCKSYND